MAEEKDKQIVNPVEDGGSALEQAEQSQSLEQQDHKHEYKIEFAHLINRNPEYVCKKCGAKLRPVMGIRIVEKIAFYVMLAIILFSTDLGKSTTDQPQSNTTLIWLAKIVGGLLFYFVVRLILARFGHVEPIPEPIAVKVELTEEQKAEKIAQEEELNKRQEEISTEKQALVDLYKQYETDRPEEDVSAPSETHIEEDTGPVCEHKLKQTWKNYIPGKQTFTCLNCESKLKLTKKQSNVINIVALVAFFALLLKDTLDLSISFGEYSLKVLLVLVIMGVTQAIVINVYPLRGEDEEP
ncbi:MAG: hypothetical protein ACOX2M_09480 [Fastidiosipilaceae bacterium]|jgi:hypothetical protein